MTLLKAEGRVRVREIAKRLSVTEETARRDLRHLERNGQLRRMHGGAVLPRSQQDQPLLDRSRVNIAQKSRIAMIAEHMVKDGMAIFLDTGTTTLALARRLAGRRVSVTTNSLDIALTLRHENTEVKLTPGTLRLNDNALTGFSTIQYVQQHLYDIAFIGIAGCNIKHGWTDYAESEVVLRRTLREQARQSILLVDSSKYGRQAYIKTFALDEIKHIITDTKPTGDLLETLNEHDVRLTTD